MPGEQTAVADANKLLDGRLVNEMPTPDAAPPATHPLPETDAPLPPTGGAKKPIPIRWAKYRDNFGRGFDADLHEVDDKGEPRIAKSGKLMFKRGNNSKAKLKSRVATADEVAAGQPAPADGATMPQNAEVKASALMTVSACVAAARMMLGDEWKPEAGEVEELTTAAEAVMIENGSSGMSPKGALFLLVGTFIAKRLSMPQTQSRLASIKAKATPYVAYWMGRMRGAPANPSSPDASAAGQPVPSPPPASAG